MQEEYALVSYVWCTFSILKMDAREGPNFMNIVVYQTEEFTKFYSRAEIIFGRKQSQMQKLEFCFDFNRYG